MEEEELLNKKLNICVRMQTSIANGNYAYVTVPRMIVQVLKLVKGDMLELSIKKVGIKAPDGRKQKCSEKPESDGQESSEEKSTNSEDSLQSPLSLL